MQHRVLSDAECEQLETTYIKRGVSPTADALVKMLSDELSKYSRVFILIDALDELKTESRDSLLYLLSEIPTCKNLLVTSRISKDKTSMLSDVRQLEIRAKEADLTDYINGRMQANPRLASKLANNRNLKQQIKDTVTKKADGM